MLERSQETDEPELLFETRDVPLAGLHNLENAMAAALMSRSMGARPDQVRKGLRTFRGLPHRVERCGERAGVVWYDDSKGTNMRATERSLEGFAPASVHLILGGRNKDADPAELRNIVAAKAAAVYLIGESVDEFAAALCGLDRAVARDESTAVPVHTSETLERAVTHASSAAKSGEVVLLSPACASFDQFRDYIHRGERFQELVSDWLAAWAGDASAETATTDTASPDTASPNTSSPNTASPNIAEEVS